MDLKQDSKKEKGIVGRKVCEACGEPFPCNPGNCWCDEVTVDEKTRQNLKAKFNDCLCEKCLKSS
ncbi:MAG: cysteine-rich CWC family protein [Deltaproteobacteria bacterium]|nr:cysteine-rich CWC family protein [Deltaproteobacteria bacterium]